MISLSHKMRSKLTDISSWLLYCIEKLSVDMVYSDEELNVSYPVGFDINIGDKSDGYKLKLAPCDKTFLRKLQMFLGKNVDDEYCYITHYVGEYASDQSILQPEINMVSNIIFKLPVSSLQSLCDDIERMWDLSGDVADDFVKVLKHYSLFTCNPDNIPIAYDVKFIFKDGSNDTISINPYDVDEDGCSKYDSDNDAWSTEISPYVPNLDRVEVTGYNGVGEESKYCLQGDGIVKVSLHKFLGGD